MDSAPLVMVPAVRGAVPPAFHPQEQTVAPAGTQVFQRIQNIVCGGCIPIARKACLSAIPEWTLRGKAAQCSFSYASPFLSMLLLKTDPGFKVDTLYQIAVPADIKGLGRRKPAACMPERPEPERQSRGGQCSESQHGSQRGERHGREQGDACPATASTAEPDGFAAGAAFRF